MSQEDTKVCTACLQSKALASIEEDIAAEVKRGISTSAQRFRGVFRARTNTRPVAEQLRAAFQSYGLRVDTINITSAPIETTPGQGTSGYVLAAKGWHEDGIPFAFASQSFVGDPVARATQAAADIVAAHIGKPAPSGVTTTALQTTTPVVAVATTALQAAPAVTASVTTTPTSAAALPPLPSFLQPKPKASTPMATAPTITKPTATHKAQSFAQRLQAVHTKLNADMEDGVTKLEQIEASAEQVNAKISSIVAQKNSDLDALNDVLNQLTNGAPDDEPAVPAATSTTTVA